MPAPTNSPDRTAGPTRPPSVTNMLINHIEAECQRLDTLNERLTSHFDGLMGSVPTTAPSSAAVQSAPTSVQDATERLTRRVDTLMNTMNRSHG